jgi:hypothetical protein
MAEAPDTQLLFTLLATLGQSFRHRSRAIGTVQRLSCSWLLVSLDSRANEQPAHGVEQIIALLGFGFGREFEQSRSPFADALRQLLHDGGVILQ